MLKMKSKLKCFVPALFMVLTISAHSSSAEASKDNRVEVNQLSNTNICFTMKDTATTTVKFRVSKQVNCKDVSKEQIVQYSGTESNVLIDGEVAFAKVVFGGTEVETERQGDKVFITKVVKNDIDVLSRVQGQFYNQETGKCISNIDGFSYTIKCVPPAWEKSWWQFW